MVIGFVIYLWPITSLWLFTKFSLVFDFCLWLSQSFIQDWQSTILVRTVSKLTLWDVDKTSILLLLKITLHRDMEYYHVLSNDNWAISSNFIAVFSLINANGISHFLIWRKDNKHRGCRQKCERYSLCSITVTMHLRFTFYSIIITLVLLLLYGILNVNTSS